MRHVACRHVKGPQQDYEQADEACRRRQSKFARSSAARLDPKLYVDALGGKDKIEPSVMIDITRAADLVAIAEQRRADALRGVEVDMGDLVRLEGAADRAVRRLGIKSEKRQASPLVQLLQGAT